MIRTPCWPRRDEPIVDRRATLPSEPSSAGAARRLLRQVAAEAGTDDWLDAAELATTELVTNALLHAHSDVDLRVVAYPDEVCVEVADRSPVLPVARDYDVQATTGRGLGVVASVASSFGVEPLGDDGKAIWFCVAEGTTVPEQPLEDVLEMWKLDLEEPERHANVVLLSMPATLWLSARQHHDALLRELALYAAEHEVEADLASADLARSTISGALARAIDAACAEGRATSPLPPTHPSPLPWVPAQLDLELEVPLEHLGAFLVLPDVLDQAERLAVRGELLVRPGLPEVIAVRDWACEQVVAQLTGAPAAPWPGTAQERFETEVHDAEEPAWDATAVVEAERGVIAADDANRILAISRPLAGALGWDPDQLVGRRVVTLIPPQLREAHVAGFSRHLSTGEAHVLGVPLELPVLHADGREVACSFLVERAASEPGRSVYLAWIEPLDGDVGAGDGGGPPRAA